MRRLLMLSAAVLIPVSGASLGFAGVAGAATTSSSVACAKLGGTLTGTNATLKNCSDPRATGGKGTVPISALETGSGTITWNGTGTTTLDNVTETPPTTMKCASGDEEFLVAGDVNGGTGQAVIAIPSGDTFKADACLNPTTLKLSLAPGTKLKFKA